VSARERILGRVRDGLRGVAEPPLPPLERPPAAAGDELTAFVTAAEAVGVRFFERLDEALGAARTVALSDAPAVREAAAALDGRACFDGWADRGALLEADAGLTTAQLAVAETGTLVLVGDEERHRLAGLLPPLHVVLLRRDRILPTLGAALAALHREDPAAMSRVTTFVTGPSRTADIELQLVLGVHGPRALHVVLTGPPPTEPTEP
jgi:L-lactate utilization protein LutC